MSDQQKCPCGWVLPTQWSINVAFEDDLEEVVELPDGAEDDTDDMQITVQMTCPQCHTLHVVEPDGVDHGPVSDLAN